MYPLIGWHRRNIVMTEKAKALAEDKVNRCVICSFLLSCFMPDYHHRTKSRSVKAPTMHKSGSDDDIVVVPS